jgi:creatinine amidohydrolase/Fe(II)-dependent formamide hydrolase-like protein
MNDALKTMEIFDELRVKVLKLEPNRLTATYALSMGDQVDGFDLIYRFEEPVFEPQDPACQNLAAMMAAQPALNYGLFCRKIVFEGFFDGTDRRFLRTMAENTAREIYVKKFLEPNPFLIGPASELPAMKQPRYCRARIEFSRTTKRTAKPNWTLWPTRPDRYAVLSSGGKDSLLSFCLMTEVVEQQGGQVHPLFVNESGRHWFTALNAYRHLRGHVPHTARVWVNSDRLFNWMLRHMPFIRKDFADVRSDEYPIRLWTVAIFLFGVLPLMRKRGLGCLLVGDEYDTTARRRFKGISHYDGLYDQSIYFDHTLSRYFLQKGWAVSQFSILRPLSELLVETILVKRYPDFQKLQTSCHATHKTSEGMRPCGRCEKCRRIVGMLLAIGADPAECGYTTEQIEHCLKLIIVKGIHQEEAGAQHLMHLLTNRKVIAPEAAESLNCIARPEIMQLRFDSQRSPVHGIPRSLRTVLWSIYLNYAEGAVQLNNAKWVPLDILRDPALSEPFAFEFGALRQNNHFNGNPTGQFDYLWGHLSWTEAEAYFKKVDVALLPVGAIEQHGPHLPLDTDTFDADYLARRVAESCSDPKPLVLPAVPYGVSYHHQAFKGTISISNDTLSKLIYDIGVAAASNGIRKLIMINGHGGNVPALNFAAQMINQDTNIFVCVDTGDTSDVDIAAIVETDNDVHAGEIETSTALAVRPELVRMAMATTSVPAFSSDYLQFSSKRGVNWYAYTHKISDTGVMGDPCKATAAKGEKIWQAMIAHLVSLVEDLKQVSLEDIHQGQCHENP